MVSILKSPCKIQEAHIWNFCMCNLQRLYTVPFYCTAGVQLACCKDIVLKFCCSFSPFMSSMHTFSIYNDLIESCPTGRKSIVILNLVIAAILPINACWNQLLYLLDFSVWRNANYNNFFFIIKKRKFVWYVKMVLVISTMTMPVILLVWFKKFEHGSPVFSILCMVYSGVIYSLSTALLCVGKKRWGFFGITVDSV
jgi:hypothetical protein